MSKSDHVSHLEEDLFPTDSLHPRDILSRITRRLQRWNCSPEELEKRRMLRRARRLKAKKEKQPKKTRRFKRRKSPPHRRNHLRKMTGSKHRNQSSRHLPGWKSKRYLAKLDSATEALILSWLPCFSSKVRASFEPAPNGPNVKTESFKKRNSSGSRAWTATVHEKAGEGQEISSRSKPCQRCRWAGKQRVVISRRRTRRRGVTRTTSIRNSAPDSIAGAMSSNQDCAKVLDGLTLSRVESLSPIRSSLLHLEPMKPLGSLQARSPGIIPWNWWQGLGLVRHHSGFRPLPTLLRGRQERRPHGSSLGGCSSGEAHPDMKHDGSYEVRYTRSRNLVQPPPCCSHATLVSIVP